ncbi:MAG: diguanylate cyclase [Cycloclasticus sp.]
MKYNKQNSLENTEISQPIVDSHDICGPVSRSENRKRQIKKFSMLRAAAGFFLLILATVPFIDTMPFPVPWVNWYIGLASTFLIWGSLWLAIHYQLDKWLTFDPHFLLTPAAIASIQICIFVYLAPELRPLVIGWWITVLLFGAGLFNFREAMILNGIMALGYIITTRLSILNGEPLLFDREVSLTLLYLAFWTYCAMVLGRFQRYRQKSKLMQDELTNLAYNDSLTKMPNRRAFYDAYERESAYCQRTGEKFAVGIIDVDYFKLINDQNGHHIGDKALIDISAIITSNLRTEDLAARLGGDEFIILMRNDSAIEAKKILERIRYAVQRKTIMSASGEKISLSISAGTAISNAGITTDEIIRRADAALYTAKQKGRNRVWHYDSSQKKSNVSNITSLL